MSLDTGLNTGTSEGPGVATKVGSKLVAASYSVGSRLNIVDGASDGYTVGV